MAHINNNEYNRISFFLNIMFQRKKELPFDYILTHNHLKKEVYKNKSSELLGIKNNLHSIYDLPDYLKIKTPSHSSFKILTAPLYNGYLINLSNYKDYNEYLESNFGKTSRSKLRRYSKRLDLCISPEYKMIYGHISRDEYDSLFNQLKLMLELRFSQKKRS